MFRRFNLVRAVDVSGVSGTGIVAQGVEFKTGKTVINWCSRDIKSVTMYDSIDDVLRIHGHGESTKIEFLDGGEDDYESFQA